MNRVHLIGNAHLDPVWLWPWQDGYQEVLATFRSALDRMNETPDFVFTCACACYYAWVEESAPEMFEEIKKRVEEGRWILAGGMWIQPDMNAPSGEALARQLLISQRYFYEKFGKIAHFGYNVDSFGHNAMVPQLLSKAGMEAYVWMRPEPHENPRIPDGPLVWKSADGSRVLAYHIHGGYGSDRDIADKIDKHVSFSKELGQSVMCFYGVGNHGGGPTIKCLKTIDDYRRENAAEDKVLYSSPDSYFEDLSPESLPVWEGELQHHASGCYSTHSRSKKLHRETENLLLRAEKYGVLSSALTGVPLDTGELDRAWKNVLFNEFHDVMGGCSLEAALRDCEIQLYEAESIAARTENLALQRLSHAIDTKRGLESALRSKEEDWSLWGIRGQGTPVVVFNPHPFEVTQPVRILRPVKTIRDSEGHPVAVQSVRAARTNGSDCIDSIFPAAVPPFGYRVYWVYLEESGDEFPSSLKIAEHTMENRRLYAEWDPESGALIHLVNKETGYDALRGPSSVRLMDIEKCDTWAHGVFRFDKEAGAFERPVFTVLEKGPVRAVLQVTTFCEESELEQKFILEEDSDELLSEVRLDSHLHFRMVKMCFPCGGTDCAQIPYGVIKREPNCEEQPCQSWIAMQTDKGGLAVINDAKYSYSAVDGELRLTIANTSLYADHFGQENRDGQCRFMDQGEQFFRYSLLPYGGDQSRQRLCDRAARLNQPLKHIVETYHDGPLPEVYSGMTVTNAGGVTLGALKRSADGTGTILRMAETAGEEAEVKIDCKALGRAFACRFTPFEIKTLFLPDNPGEDVREVKLTELDD